MPDQRPVSECIGGAEAYSTAVSACTPREKNHKMSVYSVASLPQITVLYTYSSSSTRDSLQPFNTTHEAAALTWLQYPDEYFTRAPSSQRRVTNKWDQLSHHQPVDQ